MFFLVNVAGVAIRIPILHYVEPVLLDALKPSMPHGAITPEFASPEPDAGAGSRDRHAVELLHQSLLDV